MIKLDVPFYKQIDDNACGAAVLEMVYKFWNLVLPPSQQDIMETYKELEPHGSGNFRITSDNIVLDAKKRGFESFWEKVPYNNKEATTKIIKGILKQGVPIIVCQQFTKKDSQTGHFRIIIGFTKNKFILHDPHPDIGSENLEWPAETLLDYWQPTGENVTGGVLIIIKPG